MYFTNYFRVCIFVYLLSINFVRVLIVYFQKYRVFVYCNKFHCQLRKNCTYLLQVHSMHVKLHYILLLLYMNLHVPVLFIPHVLNASTDTVSYAVRDQNVLRDGEGAKPGHENFANNRYNL